MTEEIKVREEGTRFSVPIERINEYLKNNYGSFDNKPKFRLTWANDELEKRLGTFIDYLPGTNIFLREVTEVRELPKYRNQPNYRDCFILERLIPNYHKELMGRLTYEPIWVYDVRLNDGSIKHPTFEAVQFFMKMSIEGPTKGKEYYTSLADKEATDTLSYYENILGNDNDNPYSNDVIIREFD